MGKKEDKRYAGARLAGKSREEYFANQYGAKPRYGSHPNMGRVRLDNPEENSLRASTAAATGSWIRGGSSGKDDKKFGKRGYAAPYLAELSNQGYGAQNILQAADQLGIKSINSKNDYKAIKNRLEQVYDPNKFSGGKDKEKDIEGYKEAPKNVDRDAYDSGEKKSPVDEAKERSQRFKERMSGTYFKSDEELDKQGIEGYKDNPFSYS